MGTRTLGLSFADIKKDAGGRNFSCHYSGYGQRDFLLGTYTPFLVYGPDNVTITAINTVPNDDQEKMVTTLTCSASVKPTAKFQWQGLPAEATFLHGCSIGDYIFSETVTFDSNLYQGGNIKCTVTNTGEYWPKSVEKEVSLPKETESCDAKITLITWLAVGGWLVVLSLGAFWGWKSHCRRAQEQPENEGNDQTERKRRAGSSSTGKYNSTGSSGMTLI
ncbi:hypothetical protein V1264_024879 [Littorina saxatilis]|uniref:Ig-like domain-containing protein n=1 Tax=Littorina saxatilis TaxID=31220 RepID=A0AAN9FY23_9CAEN